MIVFSVNKLAKSYGPRGVFHSLSFSSSSGSITAITGPNGSGKSTLSRVLMGLTPPSSGKITVTAEGREVDIDRRLRLMATVTPYFSLYEALTGAENFVFFHRLRGRKAGSGEIDRWLDVFGLGGRGNDPLGDYSSGMRQRLKFAISVSLKPEILFLDEPASNLDSAGKEIVFAELLKLKAETVIFWATNEPEELQYADKVVRLV